MVPVAAPETVTAVVVPAAEDAFAEGREETEESSGDGSPRQPLRRDASIRIPNSQAALLLICAPPFSSAELTYALLQQIQLFL